MSSMDADEQRAASAAQAKAQMYRDVFEVDRRGAAIFEDLYRQFASKAKVHTDGGIDAVLKTYKDAAHREVIEYIVRQINRANNVQDSDA